LHLDGVDPVNDTVLWQRPYSASAITPGVALTPAADGTTVADVIPAGNPTIPAVTIDGIDAATGSVEWHLPGAFIMSDNPAPCLADQDFCIPAYTTDGSSQLAIIDAATGRSASVLEGPSRALGRNLYQSSDESPTLEQLSAAGSIAWTEPVATVFGPGYDPGTGWNISPVGTLNVGSVGLEMQGSSVDLSRYRTVGFTIATGTPLWSISGSYQCMGPLSFVSTPVTCQYKGIVHYSKTSARPPSLHGVTLRLIGFNATTGSTTWSYPVSDVSSFTTGNGLRFVDADHVVVQSATGKTMSLDTTTGSVAPLAPHQVLWCEKTPTYSVDAMKGAPDGGTRSGETLYYPCRAGGATVAGEPPSTPSTIGITVNGVFVWPSPNGVETRVLGAPVASP
jgi:hypothetical protein